MTDQIRISENDGAQRYEIHVGDKLAGFAEFRPVGNARMLPHTEIFEGFEGQGLASRLIKHALDDVRARGLNVVPMCPFVAAYIRDHREYTDLVQPGQRAVFGL